MIRNCACCLYTMYNVWSSPFHLFSASWKHLSAKASNLTPSLLHWASLLLNASPSFHNELLLFATQYLSKAVKKYRNRVRTLTCWDTHSPRQKNWSRLLPARPHNCSIYLDYLAYFESHLQISTSQDEIIDLLPHQSSSTRSTMHFLHYTIH